MLQDLCAGSEASGLGFMFKKVFRFFISFLANSSILSYLSCVLKAFNFILFFKFFIGVQLIYNVVLVSGIQHSDSAIHTHIFILFQILFPPSLL